MYIFACIFDAILTYLEETEYGRMILDRVHLLEPVTEGNWEEDSGVLFMCFELILAVYLPKLGAASCQVTEAEDGRAKGA